MEYGLNNQEVASEVALELLKVGAIKLNSAEPFTWASGWKSPIYCDNRISLSYPDLRTKIKKDLCQVVREKYSEVDAIAGVATAGIPQGALIAESLNLPFIYVRSKPKGHGMENMIEGRLRAGQKLVVVEDLISTGGSSLKAVEALRVAGGDVLGLLAIFNYGFDIARENCAAANVNVTYLSDYDSLLPQALQAGLIKREELDSLNQWRLNPAEWKK